MYRKDYRYLRFVAGLGAFLLLTLGETILAQPSDQQELAKKTQNPVSDLISLPIQNNVNLGILESVFIQGPLSIQGEAAFTGVSSSEMSNPSFYAFYVYASYILSGETRSYVPGGGAFKRVRPKREFRDGAGGLGAFEIAFRFSRIDLDDKDVTGGRLNDLTAAFNWYATRHYRVLTNVIRAHRSEDEPVWIFQIRLQLAI